MKRLTSMIEKATTSKAFDKVITVVFFPVSVLGITLGNAFYVVLKAAGRME